MRDDRGQSELLGFVLIFGIVILAIATIGTAGFDGLDSVKEYQQTTNAEQGFTALSDTIDDIVRHGAPSRTTEIGLADATMRMGEVEELRITSAADEWENRTVASHPIVYGSGEGTTISYSNGAVIRTDDGHSVMIDPPNLVIEDDQVILPLIETVDSDGRQVGGTTAVSIRTTRVNTDIVTHQSTVDESITLEMTTPHAVAWTNYFQEQPGVVCQTDPAEDDVSCEISANEQALTISVTRVDVSLRS